MSDATLQGLWTKYGRDRLADWISGGPPVRFAQVAVGGGGGSIPAADPLQTALVEETWRGPVNNVLVNPDDATDVVVDTVIPNNIGGFWIREWGIFDEHDKLVAVGPHDEMHKPKIESGQAVEFLLRLHLPVSNSASVVITIADHALASREYVSNYVGKKLDDHNADSDAHPALPNATTTKRGLIRLATPLETDQRRRDDVAVTPAGGHIIGQKIKEELRDHYWWGGPHAWWWRSTSGLMFQGGLHRQDLWPDTYIELPLPVKWKYGPYFASGVAWNGDGHSHRDSHVQFVVSTITSVGFYVQWHQGSLPISGINWIALGD